MRIIEYRGGPADGKIEAVSNNRCAESLYLDPDSIHNGVLDLYLYTFDGFTNEGKLIFKFVSKVDETYQYKTGMGPTAIKKVATPVCISC